MKRISLFVLFGLLAGVPTVVTAQTTTPQLVAALADIGWTKAQVRKQNGEPARKSPDGNIWYYRGLTVQFTNGRVSGFPGGAA